MNTKYLKVLQLIISVECVKTYPCHIFSALLPSSCHACHLKRISDIKPNPSTTRRVREHKMYFQNKNAIIMMYLFLLFKTHDFLHSILNILTADKHFLKDEIIKFFIFRFINNRSYVCVLSGNC